MPGIMDWRIWALTPPALHLLILLLFFLLLCNGWWLSYHHRRIENLSLEARTTITELVDEHWENLLSCAKDLLDASLEDGNNFTKLS